MRQISSEWLARANLLSASGSAILGAGLALLMPELLQAYALPMVGAGIVLHGAGMSLRYRLEHAERVPLWWERLLFWICCLGLALLAGWVAIESTRLI